VIEENGGDLSNDSILEVKQRTKKYLKQESLKFIVAREDQDQVGSNSSKSLHSANAKNLSSFGNAFL
jgi:hypothetical protein